MNLETEGTLQGEFYHACRLLELQVILELVTPVGRVDAAILNLDRTRLLAVIECKRRAFSFLNGKSAQITRYKTLGVPVYGLSFEKDPHHLAATLKSVLVGAVGMNLSELDQWRRNDAQDRDEQKEARKVYRLARFKRYHPRAGL